MDWFKEWKNRQAILREEFNSLNNQNFIGNLYLSGSKNRFLKKKR